MSQSPKMFLSYSWTTPEYEENVLVLAQELRAAGVDVVLDKWDLKEGQDANAFMERMVTDTTVNKVGILCDRLYAEKANGRSGGVGTESQIISQRVYESTEQTKFVVIVMERGDDGKAFLPAYYTSRIYIDLSDPASYAENFEKLLRWLYDKPLHVKPELGKSPAFLLDDQVPEIGTSILFRRVLDALKSGKSYAGGALDEYFDDFLSHLERFRLSGEFNDDDLIKNIEAFVPARNEFIQVVKALARYALDKAYAERIHGFFERVIPYLSAPESISSWRESDYDNFKFMVHELFLYALAIAIKLSRFDLVSSLFDGYYVEANARYGKQPLSGYEIFRNHISWLEHRNKRLNLGKISLHASILKERNIGTGVEFSDVMQADFIAYVRSELHQDQYNRWWPTTLVFAARHHGPFEFFARGASARHLPNILAVLGVGGLDPIDSFLEKLKVDRRRAPTWQFDALNVRALLGRDHLNTRP